MKSKRGLAFAVTGASVGLFGVSVTVGGLAYQQGGPNLGPAVVFGPPHRRGWHAAPPHGSDNPRGMKPRMHNSSALR